MNRSEQFFHEHPRLFCWLLALLGAGITLYEWYAYRHETFYHPTAAVIGPTCAISFGAMGLFPSAEGKAVSPEKRKKILQVIVVFALIVGLFNWYAMTHF